MTLSLGNNLGYPVTGEFAPELKEAIARILKAAQTAGKKAGIYCPNAESAQKAADQGFNMVNVSGDLTALLTFLPSQLKDAKGGWGHAATQAVRGAASTVASQVQNQEK
jgi:4-hydroxy-2-oxoheptanedioate aldolase